MSPPPPSSPHAARTVAVIANTMAPYRYFQFHRIADALDQERTGLRVMMPILFEHNNIAWPMPPLDRFGGVVLGPGETVPEGSPLRSWVRGVSKGLGMLRLLRRHNVRAVVVSGYMFSEYWMALLWAKVHGIPAFVIADSNAAGDTARGLRGGLKRLIVGTVVRLCHGVMPVGSRGAEYFARYGATPDRTFVVTFEVDPDLARPLSPDELREQRAWTGFSPDRRRILCSGRLRDFKRFHDAIDAFVAIADERPTWDLVIAGDGPERANLERRVPERLRGRVRFLGMITDPARVMALFKDTHLFLHPAGYEPWGMVIQEACAAGLPIIATDVSGAAADLVQNDDNGFRISVGDVAGMSRALRKVTDDDAYARFATNARTMLDRWHERFEAGRGFVAAMRSAGVC